MKTNMKTNLTRLLLMLLVATFALTAFAGCNEEPASTPKSTETQPPREEELTDNLPQKDMDNFELRIHTNSSAKFTWAEVTLAPDDYTGEEIYDEMFERNDYISERFNCEITVTQEMSSLITAEKIQTFAMSGDSSTGPHIVMHYDKHVMGSAQYFLDWADVPYVSIGEEYWSPGVSELFNIRGKQIALSGSFSLGMISRIATLLFNKGMYEDYYGDLSGIYNLVENNEWTIEKLYEIGQGVVENPDEIWDDTDQFGISSAPKTLYTYLMVGSGIKFLEKDESGNLDFTLPGDSYAIEKMQKILQLNQDNDAYYDKLTDVHNNNPVKAFENGRALFNARAIFYIPKVRAEMEEEFGIMPIPKYDAEQKEYRSLTCAGELACLLVTVTKDDMENIGILMEALSFDSHQNLIPLYMDRVLKTRYASDEESRAMLDIVINSAVSDIGQNAFEDVITVPLIKAVYMTKTDVISSTLQNMTPTVRSEIAKMITSIKQ